MLKKHIKYTDYNGVEREEDFYFNLSKAELITMEYGVSGGLTEMIQKIIETKDLPKIMEIFQDLIRKSYGVKSLDGKQIVKNDDVWKEFEQSEAYSELFMQLVTDEKEAADFINGIIPASLRSELDKTALPAPIE